MDAFLARHRERRRTRTDRRWRCRRCRRGRRGRRWTRPCVKLTAACAALAPAPFAASTRAATAGSSATAAVGREFPRSLPRVQGRRPQSAAAIFCALRARARRTFRRPRYRQAVPDRRGHEAAPRISRSRRGNTATVPAASIRAAVSGDISLTIAHALSSRIAFAASIPETPIVAKPS